MAITVPSDPLILSFNIRFLACIERTIGDHSVIIADREELWVLPGRQKLAQTAVAAWNPGAASMAAGPGRTWLNQRKIPYPRPRPWHGRGQGFDSPQVHQTDNMNALRAFFFE